MNTYIEYKLEDGGVIRVLAPSGAKVSGPTKSSPTGDQVIQAEKTFSESLEGVIHSAGDMLKKIKTLKADEVELTFGLLATGELGNFAVGKVGVEASYEVKLIWKNTKTVQAEK